MDWQYKEFEGSQALMAAQRNITDALHYAQRPHLFGQALFSINAALRRLAEAQWRLMQAKSEFENQKKK